MRITGSKLRQIIREEIARSRKTLLETNETTEVFIDIYTTVKNFLDNSKREYLMMPGVMNGEIFMIVSYQREESDSYDRDARSSDAFREMQTIAQDVDENEREPKVITEEQARRAIEAHRSYSKDETGLPGLTAYYPDNMFYGGYKFYYAIGTGLRAKTAPSSGFFGSLF